MAPPQESSSGSFRQHEVAEYATEPKRMRLSGAAKSAAVAAAAAATAAAAAAAAAGSSTTTRASTGAPTAMTNKGSVYKAQRGRAVSAAAVKAKAPTTHRRRGRRGKSVYRGVCVTREGKWRAVIYKERKQLYLGVYESEVDAAKAHDRAARFHFADSAVCNFDSEHEADRQAVIHKQRQLLQQQQLAEDPAAAAAAHHHHHHAQLHGGSFSVGREEFDDLEEYHRGMDEATTCSSEEDDGEGLDNDESLHGDDIDDDIEDSVHGEEEEDHRSGRGRLDGDDDDELPAAECDMSDEGGDRYEEDGVIGGGGTSGRSMSCSYSSAMSTGSMSDGGAGAGAGAGGWGHRGGHSRSRSCEVTTVADGTAFAQAAAAAAAAVAVSHSGGAGNGINTDLHAQQLEQQRGRCSSGESDCSSDFVTPSLLREESMSSTTQEGMGFPVAEDLLGYEMQSWYCCQDDEERSPSTSGGASFGRTRTAAAGPAAGACLRASPATTSTCLAPCRH
ncbi:unnamed protein product [Ectocarpus sp. 12 AP-2014]